MAGVYLKSKDFENAQLQICFFAEGIVNEQEARKRIKALKEVDHGGIRLRESNKLLWMFLQEAHPRLAEMYQKVNGGALGKTSTESRGSNAKA